MEMSWEQCEHDPVSSCGVVLSLSFFVQIKYSNEIIGLLSQGQGTPFYLKLVFVGSFVFDLNSAKDEGGGG